MLATLLLLASAGSPPALVTLAVGEDHYFGADAYTSADYLYLQADGRYQVVDVQHMFTRVADTGRWRVADWSVILESDHAVRNIDLGEFQVYLFDRCGEQALPSLRDEIRKLRDGGKPVSPKVLDKLAATRTGDPQGRGPASLCGASLGYFPNDTPAGPVPVERLDPVLAAIDEWLATAAKQHLFEYQAWEYRGERFLVPMRTGIRFTRTTVGGVREDMDLEGGGRAPYVYYAIPATEHAQRTNCTYAFKFHPGMNAPCNDE